MKTLAPIVLFVYNRPFHTEKTLQQLSLNELADQSVLYIYADGAKNNATPEFLNRIEETRKVIRAKKWCKEIHIIEAQSNQGLAASVIKGVTEIIQKYGKVIVLEDDILTAKGFLKFMNESLEMYENETKVAGVSGWSFQIKQSQETYFSRVGACWGWATWSRVWNEVNFNSIELIEKLKESERIHEYNIDGAYNYYSMLNKQASGEVDSWAVRFYTNYFLANSLFLFPQKSLIQNIGFDGTGTNYNSETPDEISNASFEKEFVNLSYVSPVEKQSVRKKIIESFQTPKKKTKFLRNLISRIKRKLS